MMCWLFWSHVIRHMTILMELDRVGDSQSQQDIRSETDASAESNKAVYDARPMTASTPNLGGERDPSRIH